MASGMRFSALEAGRGPVVLCLHGFPDLPHTFRHQLPALARAGFHAVAPTLRGYEPETVPPGGEAAFSLPRLVEDALGWLDDLDARDAHVIGHDWGAVVATALAVAAPRRVRTLTTLAVPWLGRPAAALAQVPGQAINSWYALFFQLRGAAESALARDDFALVDRLWASWSPGWTPPEAERRRVKDALAAPGVAKAALSYYRAMLSLWRPSARQSWALAGGTVAAATLALTGARDGCMDTRLFDVAYDLAAFPGGLEVQRVARAGHFLHQERPEAVNAHLLRWLTHQGSPIGAASAKLPDPGGDA